jgi:predicted nucleic acid-binding protein
VLRRRGDAGRPGSRVLVDTSVWIDHFRRPNRDLEELLDEGRVVTHPFVIGELACGSLHHRAEVLRLLDALPAAPLAAHHEVLMFVERQRLYGSGLGWIDLHLLASARLMHHSLWSTDRRLRTVAVRIGLADLE